MGKYKMKWVFDERLKHRLVGVIVLLILAIMVVPSIMKTSAYSSDNKHTLALKLPPKPNLPKLERADKVQIAFKTPADSHPKTQLSPPKKAQSKLPQLILDKQSAHIHAMSLAADNHEFKNNISRGVIKKQISHQKIKKKPIKNPRTQTSYVIQLASFSIKNNALFLANKLKKHGYQTRIKRTRSQDNWVYQVLIYGLAKKQTAIAIKTELAHTMKLNGLIIPISRIS